ncbi:LysM domain-containing protein, partial [Tolypocladium paradoxum]
RHIIFLLNGGFLLLASIESCLGAVAGVQHSKPGNPVDSNTTPHCTWWHDCKQSYRATNPSITSTCEGLAVGHSYCVEAAFEPETPTVPGRTTTTLEGQSTQPPTSTGPSNGIETPKPTQPNIVSNCNAFFLVKRDDTCAGFQQWNPAAGSNCGGLWADAYACVSIIGNVPTKPSNGITTPTPTQPDIAGDCNKFYLVKLGDYCAAIASANGITLDDFLQWNPKAGRNCAGLWANAHACVLVRAIPQPRPTLAMASRHPPPSSKAWLTITTNFTGSRPVRCAQVSNPGIGYRWQTLSSGTRISGRIAVGCGVGRTFVSGCYKMPSL